MPKKPVIPAIERIYEPDKDRMIEALRLAVKIGRRQQKELSKEKEGAA
jgi:hypothetical protein